MKTTLIFLCLLASLLSACNMDAAFTSDPENIAGSAAEIADFTLPDGYRPELSASMEGYTLVSYHPGDGHSHLYLVQSKNAADTEELEKALGDLVPGDRDAKTRSTVLETRDLTVREQAATLVISEATNGSGDIYRQATLAFTGKSGPALMVFSEPLTSWDMDRVEDLISSIR